VRFPVPADLTSSLVGVTLGVVGAMLFGRWLGWPGPVAGAALYALTDRLHGPRRPRWACCACSTASAILAGEQAVSSIVRLIGCGDRLLASRALIGRSWPPGPPVTLASFLYVGVIAWATSMGPRKMLDGFSLAGPLGQGLPGVWRFAWATNFSGSLEVAFTHVSPWSSGSLLGPPRRRMWRVGRQVADGMAKPAKLVVPALYPELAKMRAAGGDEAMRKLARQIALLGGAVAGALLLVTDPGRQALADPGDGPSLRRGLWRDDLAGRGRGHRRTGPAAGADAGLDRARPAWPCGCGWWSAWSSFALSPMIKTYGLNGAGAALVGAGLAMAIGMFLTLRARLAQSPVLRDNQPSCADDANDAKGGR
jgi:hypothetical protein